MNKREVIRWHHKLCKELGIKPARIVFRQKARKNTWRLGCIELERNTIVLYTEECKRIGFNPLVVMAHETYHLYQKHRGWLDGYSYKGIDDELWPSQHSRQPWERAAIRYEKKIMKREGWELYND